MKQYAITILLSLVCAGLLAAEYKGKVLDSQGEPIGFATVYLEQNPMIGTATNNDGVFTIEAEVPEYYQLVVSFIGYQKQLLPLSLFQSDSLPVVVLEEQPIELEETVVMAKASKQKNRRKAMAQLLYKVYNRMQYDFSDSPYGAQLVSDVRMESEDQPWGMEQMIATVVNLPGEGREGRDSVQFVGEKCKRFFQQTIRNRADTILAGDWMEDKLRKMANEVDSGVMVHQSLWAAGNIRYDFEQSMNDLKHWSVSRESETETVLTHVAKKNFLGIFKYEYKRHYIVDSDSYSVLRFSEQMTIAVNIPFGYKLKKEELELLNLLNMSETDIAKFRLKKANAEIHLNTLYRNVDGHLYPAEKNMHTTAELIGTKEMIIPIEVWATQHVSCVEPNVQPLPKSRLSSRIQREIVSIY